LQQSCYAKKRKAKPQDSTVVELMNQFGHKPSISHSRFDASSGVLGSELGSKRQKPALVCKSMSAELKKSKQSIEPELLEIDISSLKKDDQVLEVEPENKNLEVPSPDVSIREKTRLAHEALLNTVVNTNRDVGKLDLSTLKQSIDDEFEALADRMTTALEQQVLTSESQGCAHQKLVAFMSSKHSEALEVIQQRLARVPKTSNSQSLN
jgi:hypothetical protein